MNDYLKKLKNTNLRPAKVKLREHILLDQEERGTADLHDEIIKWFMKNPNPQDDKVHAFAEKLGIDPDNFETNIYMILSALIHEGRSKNFKGKYDSKQLAMGIDIEKEHLPYPSIAEKIAKDHLAEFPDYYTRLKKMESEAKVAESLITELFIQQGEIEAMSSGARRDMAILRISMIAELDAANFYERLADLASNKDVEELMLDVANEEKVHAGEFETLLEEIDPDYEEMEEKGEDEVEELTGESLNLSEGIRCAAAKYGLRNNQEIMDDAKAGIKQCHKHPRPDDCKKHFEARIRMTTKPLESAKAAVKKHCS